MKLHLSDAPGKNLFTGYGAGYVLVNGVRHENNLIVRPESIDPWKEGDVANLAAEDFDRLAALGVEIVLLGTGTTLRFPSPSLGARVLSAGVGLEVMDSGAVCRTYNILVAEGRNVAAALIVD
ncbi:MAG: Mth938-like domain-containing protein [Sulfuricellaceae bacterium]|jgi:uncharacterized protein